MWIYACWTLWYVVMNCLVIWIITWLWYCLGGVASIVDTDFTADCYAITVLSLVMTACSGLSRRLCVVCVLWESFHMHGHRICSVRLCVAVAFWDALWFLLLGVSLLCYVWMQIRARDWWTDRESMEGEDLYMWVRCSRMVDDSICYVLFSIWFCVDGWYNLYDYYLLFWTRGTPPLLS